MPLYDDDNNELTTPEQALAYFNGGQSQVQQQPEQTPNWRRDLEQRAAAAKAEKDRADALQRQLDFAKAGIPLDHPMTDYLVAGYKGEATPEAIKAEAQRLGILQATQEAQTTAPANPAADQAATFARMAEATTGQTVPAGRNWDAEKAAATSRDALHAIVREQAQAEGRTQPAIVIE